MRVTADAMSRWSFLFETVILLDGHEVKGCVLADDEEGYVDIVDLDAPVVEADPADENDSGYRIIRKHGSVRIGLQNPRLAATTPKINAPIIEAGKDQEEYQPIQIALTSNIAYPHSNEGYNQVTMAFELNAQQREAVFWGMPIYVSLLTFGRPMQPIIVQVGPHGI